MRDPLAAGPVGYLYLFRSDGTRNPSAGKSYVKYNFNLVSGGYKGTYDTAAGPNPENSTVHSPYFDQHFSDRWIDDQLHLRSGGSTRRRHPRPPQEPVRVPATAYEARTPSRPPRAHS